MRRREGLRGNTGAHSLACGIPGTGGAESGQRGQLQDWRKEQRTGAGAATAEGLCGRADGGAERLRRVRGRRFDLACGVALVLSSGGVDVPCVSGAAPWKQRMGRPC